MEKVAKYGGAALGFTLAPLLWSLRPRKPKHTGTVTNVGGYHYIWQWRCHVCGVRRFCLSKRRAYAELWWHNASQMVS